MAVKNTPTISSLSRFVLTRPYLFVFLLVMLILLVVLPISAIVGFLPDSLHLILVEALLAGLGFLFVSRLRWWHAIGFTGGNHGKGRLIYLFPGFLLLYSVPIVLVSLIAGVTKVSFVQIISDGFYALLIGIAEETFFRGLMLQTLLPKGVLRAIFISAILFALTHSVNLLTGASLSSTLTQILLTFGWGIAFGALWVRRKSIWPLIIIHFLHDWPVFLLQHGTSTVTGAGTQTTMITSLLPLLVNGIPTILLLVYSAIILRPSQLRQVRLHSQQTIELVVPL